MKKRNLLANKTIRRVCITRADSLWKRYVLGFAIILVMLTMSHGASVLAIKAAENDAEVINISGRQTTLSQRILYLIHEADRTGSEETAQRLVSAIKLFESSHIWLMEEAATTPEIKAHYVENGDVPLDRFSRKFVSMAEFSLDAQGPTRTNILRQLSKWGTVDLLSSLNEAVRLFEARANASTQRLQTIQKLSIGAAIFILAVEALLIFLPAQVSVSRAITLLERRKSLLKRSLKKLKQRNAELENVRVSLARAANRDALTGLHNRRAVYHVLSTPDTSALGGDSTLCVMKLDLDMFKQVNDTLGHNAGDQVLVHVAEMLKRHAGPDCVVGRLGGDEFVLITPKPASLETIETRAEALIHDISQPISIAGTQAKIGVSIGYTIATSSRATPDQMLIEADLALYEAKRGGRSTARAYSKDLSAEIETRRVLFNEINDALSQDQFEPFLQPQVFTESGEIYGCEVLARWRHPERGVIPPATFIAAAEEAGLIDQIDFLMVQKGLDLLEQFDAEEVFIPCLSVNASPQTLRDPHLTARLEQEVHARHLSPSRLTVEVLESTLIEHDDDMALRTITALSAAGFAVVLDDFGTGYASMSNLSRLQLNGIKLDQSLIKPVPDPRADSIIEALVTLSRNLNMRVVAEGVETPGHFDTVQRLGCDVVQGYGISRPMGAGKFPEWYAEYAARTHPVSKRA